MDIDESLALVQERIASAAARSGRSASDITLVAVTKTWPLETIFNAKRANLHNIGENRIEELADKKAQFSEIGGSEDMIWHLIGPLQSRKTNAAADQADVFHALDRIKIAKRLSRRLVENGRAEAASLPVFLEVNVSGEATKAGIDCRGWQSDGSKRESLLASAAEVADLPGLSPAGLMTMAPWHAAETIIRQVFEQTRLLSEWLQKQLPETDWSQLSMGMTDDYEIAIEEGSTHVRVGRAIFGERT